jgi:glycosyltransferase involved in cell wall biosynthesis
MPSVQIFIATYNRPLLLEAAINSTLNQDFDSFEVIISDNSTNDETEKLISRFRDNRLKYIKRRPSLSSFTEQIGRASCRERVY